jgi:glycosyltransferase involved in cell wall biosynthesis
VNVLMATPRFLPFSGGVELHVAEVASRVAALGHRVGVLTTDPAGDLPRRETWNGVEVIRVRGYPKRADWYFAPGIHEQIRAGGWDLVHVQSYHTFVAPIAMAAAGRAAVPYVVTFHAGGHSSRLRTSARGAHFALLRPLLARAAALIALAPFEIDVYSRRLRIPRDRFRLVPNGADLPKVPAARPDAPAGPPLIASIGRLERYKGHQHVIAALPAILDERPEAHLWVAGSGPYRAELEALADRMGVAASTEIRAVPPEERSRMAEELSRVRVAVLASDFETHPIAMLEAASLGCRLVVADSPGLRDLGDRGLARVVEHAQDPEELARAVLAELEQPRVLRTLDLPSWDDCAAALCEVYREVGRSR